MSNCAMYGRCVGVRNYTKKDNSKGTKVTVADDQGNLIEFFGNDHVPEFSFGTVVSIDFDINVFNGKPSNLIMTSIKEVKK